MSKVIEHAENSARSVSSELQQRNAEVESLTKAKTSLETEVRQTRRECATLYCN